MNVDSDVLTLKENTLYVLEDCFFTSFYFSHNFSKSINSLFEEIGKKYYNNDNIKKIYISRKDCKRRACINEDDVIKFLSKDGYYPVELSNINVKEQISLFSSAKSIIAAHGASGANLIYSFNDFYFCEYFSENRFDSTHTQILKNKNCTYSSFINKISDEKNRVYKDANYICDLDLLSKSKCKILYKFKPIKSDIHAIIKKINKTLSEENVIIFKYRSLSKLYNINFQDKVNLMKEGVEKFPDNKFFNLELQKLDLISSIKTKTILTFHGTLVYIIDNYLKHLNDKNLEPISISVNNNKIFLKYNNLFINNISEDGKISLIKDESSFDYVINEDETISIIINKKFLSSRMKGGKLLLVNNNDEWERFYIIDPINCE